MSTLKKTSLIVGTIIILAIIAIVALELTNTTHIFHARPTTTATTSSSNKTYTHPNKSTKTTPKPTGPSKTETPPPSNDQKPPTAASSNQQLMAPSQDSTFSNEYSVTTGQQLQSTCITNAGAYCEMVFTKGSVTKHLSKQLTDAGGSTTWNWHPNDIGLTAGTWHIKAVASLGSQTKSTSADPLTLEVKS